MPAPSDAYGAEVWNDTPIAYWRFDGDGVDVMGGTTATLTNGAAATGATLVSTYSGAQSLAVDGTNDHATVPDAAKFDFTFSMSAEAWIKATTLTGAGGAVGKVDWGLAHSGTTLRFFALNPTTSCEWSTAASTATVYHMVATYDGANVKLYINGTLRTTTARTATLTVNAFPVEFGSWNVSTDWFDGLIDECALWDRVLTAQEVADHYTVGTGGTLSATSPAPRRRLNYGALLQV